MKRALVVGINDYAHDSLNGCVNDATSINSLISRNYDDSVNFDTKLITSSPDQKITAPDLKALVSDLLTKPADMAFFFFAGHGTATNLGGYLCTYESRKYNEGFSMQELLGLINGSPVKEIVVILDCCHSGSLGAIPALQSSILSIKEGVSILTASRDSESAAEVNGAGIFSSLVCDALGGGAADLKGIITPAGIYAHVEQSFSAWDQRPLFKSHVSRSTPIRLTRPKIDQAVLRALPIIFNLASTILQLDRSYEETEKTARAENVAVFKQLKKLQTVGLIHVNRGPDPDLYWACLEDKSCQLTPLGRFYWHLAKSSRL